MNDPCDHDWETLGTCTFSGPTYRQVYDHQRCQKCGQQAHRPKMFMDGRRGAFGKPGEELTARQRDERARCNQLRDAHR